MEKGGTLIVPKAPSVSELVMEGLAKEIPFGEGFLLIQWGLTEE